MTKAEVLQLKMTATRVRMGIIESTHSAKCGHPGGSLSAADVLTYLYFKVMNIDTENPQDPTRDRFVLSKGHCAPALYSTLAERGFFPVEDLTTLRHDGSYLEGHPNMKTVPGSGYVHRQPGPGVSTACGMALAARLQNSNINVFTLLGDGEIEEGQCWEAFMLASHYKLDNLCINDRRERPADRRPHREGHDQRAAGPEDGRLRLQHHRLQRQLDDELEQAFILFERATAAASPTASCCTPPRGLGVSYMGKCG